jgi:hypothetical protein
VASEQGRSRGQAAQPARGGKPAAAQPARSSGTSARSRGKPAATAATGETATDAPLAHALDHLRHDRLGAALDRLIAAWQQHPAAAIARLVERLGQHVDRGLPAIEGDGEELQAGWLAIASHRRSSDVGRLLARVGDATLKLMSKRLELLAGFPRDPRIAGPVLELAATARRACCRCPTRTSARWWRASPPPAARHAR